MCLFVLLVPYLYHRAFVQYSYEQLRATVLFATDFGMINFYTCAHNIVSVQTVFNNIKLFIFPPLTIFFRPLQNVPRTSAAAV